MGCGPGNDPDVSDHATRYADPPRKGSSPSNLLAHSTQPPLRANSRRAGKEPAEPTRRTNTAATASSLKKEASLKAIVRTDDIRVDVSKFVTEGKGELHKRYKESAVLGKGAFGEVRLVVDNVTKEMRAMKVIPKENCSELASASVIAEISVLKKLDHPNILKLFEFYQDADNYYLITEYCTGGELFERIVQSKHFTEQKAAVIMKQLLSAVAYCHARKIVHRYLPTATRVAT